MRFLSTAAVALMTGSSFGAAFAPATSTSSYALSNRLECRRRAPSSSSTCHGMNKLPFFAQEDTKSSSSSSPSNDDDGGDNLDSMTMEEEIELLVQRELSKTKRMSNLRNERGVEYAPWMGISEADESRIRSLMRERTEARRRRQEQERDVSGNLFRDSQAQELSGTGLSYKIIDGGGVELSWATKTEKNTRGFVVKRRAAKTNEYTVIASHVNYGPLTSKGEDGGVYRYLDDTATPGGWVYRISEEDVLGNVADVCQCLVEVETEGEQKAGLIAGVGFGLFAIAAFVAGVAMDPMNGY